MSETKTEAKAEDVIETGARAPLAKVIPIEETRVDLFNPQKWTKDDVETIKHTVCPKGIPDNEFRLFILKCQASGMNPLLGEAFCVERNVKVGGTKDNPIWGKAFVFTPGEQGLEGRADDFADYEGLLAAAVYANDKIVIDPSTREVSHQYNPASDRGRLLGAWAIAHRRGRKTPVEYVRLEEYVDARNPMWATKPATLIVKCARAAALRRAYPNRFDGIYLREEILDETLAADTQTPAEALMANIDATDRLATRAAATAQKQAEISKPDASRERAVTVAAIKATVDVVRQPTSEEVRVIGLRPGNPENARAQNEAEVQAIKEQLEKTKVPAPVLADQPAKSNAPEKPDGPVMVFGPKRGTAISALDGPEILEQIAFGESKIGSLTDKSARARVQACIDELKAESDRRTRAVLGDPPEPGASDNELL